MGYQQIKLFVRATSKFPYEKINAYFHKYLNKIQENTKEFIIGDMYNARENELWAIFSSKTQIAHNIKNYDICILKTLDIYNKLDETNEKINNFELSNKQIISEQLQEIKKNELFNINNSLENLEFENIKNINIALEKLKNEIKDNDIKILNTKLTNIKNNDLTLISNKLEELKFQQPKLLNQAINNYIENNNLKIELFNKIYSTLPLQQLFNDTLTKMYQHLVKKEEDIIENLCLKLLRFITGNYIDEIINKICNQISKQQLFNEVIVKTLLEIKKKENIIIDNIVFEMKKYLIISQKLKKIQGIKNEF